MKNLSISLIIMVMSISIFTSCKKSSDSPPDSPNVSEINPFSNGGNERNMIVVMSDMHLGADLTYAECKNNVASLEKLIKQIKVSPNVKELVINGDLIDEWFVPAPVNTYNGLGQADFVSRVATANAGVFAALNSIIQEGLILVTYVPGNHDLTITAASIESVLPGINQARDAMQGLGSYTPVGQPKIAIEHGHRYNFFCAPDPISNQTAAPGTIMPPGYFFTRLAATAFQQGNPTPGDTTPVITSYPTNNNSQDLLYKYWELWYGVTMEFPISNRFDENIIVTNINGFTGSYSVNDLIPSQTSPGTLLSVNLYNGIQDNWDARQTYNNVPIHSNTLRAIDSVSSTIEIDYQATVQYFMNPNSNKRLVVFGHTHVPTMYAAQNYLNEKCVYANSGTWIDTEPHQISMDFVVITPQSSDVSSKTYVKLYNFKNEVANRMAEDSVRY